MSVSFIIILLIVESSLIKLLPIVIGRIRTFEKLCFYSAFINKIYFALRILFPPVFLSGIQQMLFIRNKNNIANYFSILIFEI